MSQGIKLNGYWMPSWAEGWSAGTYYAGQVVSYQSHIYICDANSTTETPSGSATDWSLIGITSDKESMRFTLFGASDGADVIASGWRRQQWIAPHDGTLTDWYLLGDLTESGSVTLDIRKEGSTLFTTGYTPSASNETFEDETDTATVFQVTGDPQFTVDTHLAVGFASGFGAGGSDFVLDTYAAGTMSAGAIGSISIPEGYKFKVNSLKAVISDDFSVTFVDGSIKFTGTLPDGTTATETLTCNSSGGWQTLTFAAGLSGTYLTSLEVEIVGGTIDYLGIDDFNYTYDENPIQPSITSATNNTGSNMIGIDVDFLQNDVFTFNPGTVTTFTYLAFAFNYIRK